jgi:FKBP-type peptidyl-prolyl cis-trans isomerase FkpA
MIRTAVLLSPILFLCACISPVELDSRWEQPETIQFASSLGVDLSQVCTTEFVLCWYKTASGLYWQDMVIGTGMEAVQRDSVWVHYSGWLPDGTLFETSRGEGLTPLKFPVGVGLMLRGLDEGLLFMKVGGKRKLVVPPALAYGRAGKSSAGIPPLATVVFDVELLRVKKMP